MELNYNNSSFEEHLRNGRYKGSLYFYSIDSDEDNTYELTVSASSLSELDDEENAEISEGYSYMDQSEVMEDIAQATKEFNIDFEKI